MTSMGRTKKLITVRSLVSLVLITNMKVILMMKTNMSTNKTEDFIE